MCIRPGLSAQNYTPTKQPKKKLLFIVPKDTEELIVHHAVCGASQDVSFAYMEYSTHRKCCFDFDRRPGTLLAHHHHGVEPAGGWHVSREPRRLLG